MKKYTISFKHIEESYYTATVEAESESQAEEIFDKDPFSFVQNSEPEEIQGLEIVVNEIEEEV